MPRFHSTEPPGLDELRQDVPLTTPDSHLQESDPWADDALGRSALADTLTDLIKDHRAPLVISINGDWGTGKTFFLTRWRAKLDAEGFPAFYYNAWNDDYGSDPLIPLLHAVSDLAPTRATINAASKKVRDEFLAALGDHLSNFLRARYGFDPSRLLHEPRDDSLAHHKELKKHREGLRDALGRWTKALTQDAGTPAVCVVDELDRCRPTYAVELLERIKHIFDIENIVFVLGLNQAQLACSIRSIYGGIDAHAYLRRFFDMTVSLPQANLSAYLEGNAARRSLDNFFRDRAALLRRHGHQIFANEFPDVVSFLETLGTACRLSLRDVNQSLSVIALYARRLTTQTGLYPYLLSALLVLRLKAPDFYREFADGRRSGADAMTRFEEWMDTDFDKKTQTMVDLLEVSLYATQITDARPPLGDQYPDSAFAELHRIRSGKEPSRPHLLSESTRKADAQKAERLLRTYDGFMPRGHVLYTSAQTLRNLINLLDMQVITSS